MILHNRIGLQKTQKETAIFAKSSRRRLKWSRVGTGVVLATAISASVCAHSQQVAQVSPEAVALVESTCTDILLVQRGTIQFSVCSESLTKTLRTGLRGYSIQSAIAECEKGKMPKGTGVFATCVLDRRNRMEDAQVLGGAVESVVVTAGKLTFPSVLKPVSFAESTPTERRRKQEYACAQLGLVPGFGAFSQCVADLSMALHSEEHSPG